MVNTSGPYDYFPSLLCEVMSSHDRKLANMDDKKKGNKKVPITLTEITTVNILA